MKTMRFVAYSVLGFLISCTASKQKTEIEKPVYGVVFGDSLARGAGVTEEASRFSNCLEAKTGKRFVNMGVDGETSYEALSRLDKVNIHKAKLVIVSLGGNDALRHLADLKKNMGSGSINRSFDGKYAAKHTQTNLQQIYQSLKANGSTVVHLGISPPRTFENMRSLLRDDRLEQIAKTADDAGVEYFPKSLEGLWLDSNLMADELHPNDDGNLIVCERIYNFILPLLDK